MKSTSPYILLLFLFLQLQLFILLAYHELSISIVLNFVVLKSLWCLERIWGNIYHVQGILWQYWLFSISWLASLTLSWCVVFRNIKFNFGTLICNYWLQHAIKYCSFKWIQEFNTYKSTLNSTNCGFKIDLLFIANNSIYTLQINFI